MVETESGTPHGETALALANRAIAFDASGEHDQAARSWEAASDYADAHLRGEDIDYWIKSGFGAALYEVGAYQRSIAVSEIALDWCARIKQPLPAITLAKSYLKLGNPEKANAYLDLARGLVGDGVLDQLTPDDRALLQRD